jgi:uncharacterized protein (DUF433 family)
MQRFVTLEYRLPQISHHTDKEIFLMTNEQKLLERITTKANIFDGKPIIRGRRLAVEHVLGMLAAGDTAATLLAAYPWLEPEDIQACLLYACRIVARERVEPLILELQG